MKNSYLENGYLDSSGRKVFFDLNRKNISSYRKKYLDWKNLDFFFLFNYLNLKRYVFIWNFAMAVCQCVAHLHNKMFNHQIHRVLFCLFELCEHDASRFEFDAGFLSLKSLSKQDFLCSCLILFLTTLLVTLWVFLASANMIQYILARTPINSWIVLPLSSSLNFKMILFFSS